MRNIDKYEKEIKERLKGYDRGIAVDIDTKQLKKCGDINCVNCLRHNTECDEDGIIRWLLEEYKEPPILDKTEKRYLENVIRPFKDEVIWVCKYYDRFNKCEDISFLTETCGIETTNGLPYFKTGTMYKGMKQGKNYTLKELGLFEGEKCKE